MPPREGWLILKKGRIASPHWPKELFASLKNRNVLIYDRP